MGQLDDWFTGDECSAASKLIERVDKWMFYYLFSYNIIVTCSTPSWADLVLVWSYDILYVSHIYYLLLIY